MDYEQIRYESRDGVAWLTLNRPDRLNAWTPRMSVELADAIEHANADRAIGAIVVTGAGKGFCAGADMEDTFGKRIAGEDPGDNTAGGSGGLPAGLDWVGLVRRSKPLIAAVNGAAVGIGLLTENGTDTDIGAVERRESELLRQCWTTPEHKEAVAAFVEKRPPRFR
jgi:enoyl-CoA hydratase/carnithine racemase